MIGEAFAPEVSLAELLALDHSAHGAIEDEDSLLEKTRQSREATFSVEWRRSDAHGRSSVDRGRVTLGSRSGRSSSSGRFDVVPTMRNELVRAAHADDTAPFAAVARTERGRKILQLGRFDIVPIKRNQFRALVATWLSGG